MYGSVAEDRDGVEVGVGVEVRVGIQVRVRHRFLRSVPSGNRTLRCRVS